MQNHPEPHIEVESSEENLAYWFERLKLEGSLIKQIKQAQIVLIPFKAHGELEVPFFPETTENFYEFLKNNLESDSKVDICISDDEYKELALHHDVVTLPVIILTLIVSPIIVNVVSHYINKHISKTNSQQIVKTTFIIESKDGINKKITYEGPGDQFEKTVSEKFDQLLKEGSDGTSKN